MKTKLFPSMYFNERNLTVLDVYLGQEEVIIEESNHTRILVEGYNSEMTTTISQRQRLHTTVKSSTRSKRVQRRSEHTTRSRTEIHRLFMERCEKGSSTDSEYSTDSKVYDLTSEASKVPLLPCISENNKCTSRRKHPSRISKKTSADCYMSDYSSPRRGKQLSVHWADHSDSDLENVHYIEPIHRHPRRRSSNLFIPVMPRLGKRQPASSSPFVADDI